MAASSKLDAQLLALGLASTRTAARFFIDARRVTVNGFVVRDRKRIVSAGDLIVLHPAPSNAPDAPARPSTGRPGVDWTEAGKKSWITRRRNLATAGEAQEAARV